MKTERTKDFSGLFAHRGLYHNADGIPENSLPAFRRAAERDLGVELDVQFSSDGEVVVFHDDTLERATEASGRVDAYPLSKLREFSLFGTEERIPTFEEALRVLETGKGPLIVELKTGPKNALLCEKTLAILRKTGIRYCIESFDPRIVLWFRRHAPDVVRGQLTTGYRAYRETTGIIAALAMSSCWFHFLTKPDFIAFNLEEKMPSKVKRVCAKNTGLFAWTSKQAERDLPHYDAVIFEEPDASGS